MKNKTKVFTTIGASNHVDSERDKNDYYATHPDTLNPLLDLTLLDNKDIWECANGGGHLSTKLEELGYNVKKSDLIDYGTGAEIMDFLQCEDKFNGDIVTNPPYKHAQQFVEKSMELIQEGNKVIMFLKLTFLEGQKRKELFKKYPPKNVLVFSKRQQCAIAGNFAGLGSSAIAYAWFVWEKGFTGEPTIKWI
jgi:hypothetical protein